MNDATIISNGSRIPVIAQRREHGGVSLQAGRSHIVLSADELDRLFDFIEQIPA
jgi:hypothetical protein